MPFRPTLPENLNIKFKQGQAHAQAGPIRASTYKLQNEETYWLISRDGRPNAGSKKVHYNSNGLLNNLFRHNFPLNQVLTVKNREK